jgi:type VI secretion system protein ImpK
MSRDDPFGMSEDRERTRIRLVGAPMRREVAPLPPRAALKRTRTHPNPLINAFAPLLEFAPELESALAPDNPEALRTRLLEELIRARDAVVATGASLARPRQPLVVMMQGDVDAGAQFFARLEELERHPNRDRDLLELQYYCLALGFRGKYRVPGRSGDRSLNAVRAAAARFLRNADAEDAPLSPHWKGVEASDEPQRFTLPIWVMGLMAAGLALAIHVGLSIQLSSQATELATLVRAIPPLDRAEIERAQPAEPQSPQPVAPVEFELLPEFRAAAPAATVKALKGRESVSVARLVIQGTNPEVFQSSRDRLTEGFEPLIASIAKVILENEELIGNITVIGHTDSIPLQRTNPLSTNQRLSEARAATIADILVQNGVPRDRVRAEGRAATDPVADDSTREGRALNRRVEVLVEKRL